MLCLTSSERNDGRIMIDAIRNNADAATWLDEELAKFSANSIYGKIAPAVIWTSQGGVDGSPAVPITAENLVRKFEAQGLPLLRYHDPGLPSGNVLTAKVFKGTNGEVFVAALLGFYDAKTMSSFSDLGVNTHPVVSLPQKLPRLTGSLESDYYVDPREIADEWSEEIIKKAEFSVFKTEVSHNALDAAIKFIQITMPYLVLVWNPYVKAIADEAGKDTYRAANKWVRHILEKMKEQKNPVLSVTSFQDGCEVQFLFRGNDVAKTYQAHDAFPLAAVQAAELISSLIDSNAAPARLVYEFEYEATRWFPSYAILQDGRLVSDRNILVALEQLPKSLSLGVVKEGT